MLISWKSLLYGLKRDFQCVLNSQTQLQHIVEPFGFDNHFYLSMASETLQSIATCGFEVCGDQELSPQHA